LRDHILTIHDDGGVPGSTQGNMQDRTLFRYVDLLPAEHRLHPGPNSGLLGELNEELHGFIGDAILRVVEIEARGLDGQALTASGIICKEFPEMQLADLFVMRLEGLPGRALVGRDVRQWLCDYVHV